MINKKNNVQCLDDKQTRSDIFMDDQSFPVGPAGSLKILICSPTCLDKNTEVRHSTDTTGRTSTPQAAKSYRV